VEADVVQPRTLDELLAVLPGLRRMRTLNAALLRVLLDRGDRECTWCGHQIPKGRRQWCSDQCVKGFQLRCSASDQRRAVEKLSKGICAACGRDTLAAEREADRLGLRTWVYRRAGESQAEYDRRQAENLNRLRELGYARGQWREVDHDPPVCHGGGLCRVDELRLLCGACHADATAELAKARKRRRNS
jgi:5-methylcytosine-specific restriction enzyme A